MHDVSRTRSVAFMHQMLMLDLPVRWLVDRHAEAPVAGMASCPRCLLAAPARREPEKLMHVFGECPAVRMEVSRKCAEWMLLMPPEWQHRVYGVARVPGRRRRGRQGPGRAGFQPPVLLKIAALAVLRDAPDPCRDACTLAVRIWVDRCIVRGEARRRGLLP